MKNISISYKNLALAILAFAVAYMTATGQILNYIKFADVLNEIAFFCCAGMVAIIAFIGSFSKK